ncbi:hypothetical protein C0991_005025, partial [Blastosporella zonata]
PSCQFCGKDSFPSVAGLQKHIAQNVLCWQASKEQFGQYTTTIWEQTSPRASPEPHLNDIHTLLSEPDTVALRRAIVNNRDNEDEEDAHYVEACPGPWKAGAAWGKDIPEFEKIQQCMEQEGTPWGPF